MRTVNISDLKAQLAAHIQLVGDGEEVLVRDCNKPVARIVTCHPEDHRSEQEQLLVAPGVLTPLLKKRPASESWPEPPGNVSDNANGAGMAERTGKLVMRIPAFWLLPSRRK